MEKNYADAHDRPNFSEISKKFKTKMQAHTKPFVSHPNSVWLVQHDLHFYQ